MYKQPWGIKLSNSIRDDSSEKKDDEIKTNNKNSISDIEC